MRVRDHSTFLCEASIGLIPKRDSIQRACHAKRKKTIDDRGSTAAATRPCSFVPAKRCDKSRKQRNTSRLRLLKKMFPVDNAKRFGETRVLAGDWFQSHPRGFLKLEYYNEYSMLNILYIL